MEIHSAKEQFPVFKHHPELVYLDSAATGLVPQTVIDAMNEYYEKYSANIHRGLYEISEQATRVYESARDSVAHFLNAERDEIIFTSGTTGGLNLLARSLEPFVQPGDNIVLTQYEHHANLVPWQQLAARTGAALRFITIDEAFCLRLDSARTLIDEKTKIVSFSAISNVLGTIAPVRELVARAKEVAAVSIIDAAQSVVHQRTDVIELDCDFLVFSGHKLYGPTGIGVLYGKKNILETLEPSIFGGDMVDTVTYDRATWADLPHRFEAGTPNIAGVIGLAAAVHFVEGVGWDKIGAHERELTDYLLSSLKQVDGLHIIGSLDLSIRVGVVSFVVDGIHPHDIAEVLSSVNVAVRAGHHCAMPLMKQLGIVGTARVSIGVYNTREDIDALVKGILKAKEIFA